MNERKNGASFETETQAERQTVAASGAAPTNPMETVGHGEGAKGKIAGDVCAGAPPAAAGAAATSA
ncbi:MAG: efflux RND transporter periplasmic adaptor subunit, partial [Clostridia bacterium]|nr:efflux RND transporter periplasmic adaptor subunit [Clostridia bacterium]